MKHKTFRSITLVASFTIFLVITIKFVRSQLTRFDNYIYSYITPIIKDGITAILSFITSLGSWLTLIFTTVTLIAIPKTRKKVGYPIMVLLIIVSIVNMIIKLIFDRDRPDIQRLIELSFYDGSSYPSGHAMIGASFYGFLISSSKKYLSKPLSALLSVFFTIMIFLIGFSRVYLGVHYASDVISGFALGTFILTAFNIFLEKIENKQKSIR